MSRRFDIILDIASWCAERELPQKEVIDLIHDVLDSAGQSNYNCDDESSVAEEMNSIERSVVPIYARVIGYKTIQAVGGCPTERKNHGQYNS